MNILYLLDYQEHNSIVSAKTIIRPNGMSTIIIIYFNYDLGLSGVTFTSSRRLKINKIGLLVHYPGSSQTCNI